MRAHTQVAKEYRDDDDRAFWTARASKQHCDRDVHVGVVAIAAVAVRRRCSLQREREKPPDDTARSRDERADQNARANAERRASPCFVHFFVARSRRFHRQRAESSRVDCNRLYVSGGDGESRRARAKVVATSSESDDDNDDEQLEGHELLHDPTRLESWYFHLFAMVKVQVCFIPIVFSSCIHSTI